MRSRRRQPEPEACCPAHRPPGPAFLGDEKMDNLNSGTFSAAAGSKRGDTLRAGGRSGQFGRRNENISDAGRGSLWAGWWRSRPSSMLACLLLALIAAPEG